ncbi:CopG family ribbon-helix-helix protein [Pyrodictium occultum]|nr:ribbon-helix-helix domain-containing protein [Pyrodictium occultum]
MSISIPENLLKKIDMYAERLGFTGRSEYVRRLGG